MGSTLLAGSPDDSLTIAEITSTTFIPNSFGVGFTGENYVDHGYVLFITSTTLVIVAGIFVLLRLWSRHTSGNLGVDDLTITASLCFSVALTICMNLSVENGYGVPKASLSKPQLREALKWFFVAQVLYKVLIMFTKFSFIQLYLRIFPTHRFRIACFVMLFIVGGWSIGSVASTIWQCVPIAAAWDASITEKGCVNSDASWYQYGITNILTDVMIFAMPVRPVMKLKLRHEDKLGIIGIFSLGFMVCIVSICRVVVVANSTELKADQTGNFIPRSTLTLVEANFGIICACLPMLRLPLSFLFPGHFGKKTGTYELSSTGNLQYMGPLRSHRSVTVSGGKQNQECRETTRGTSTTKKLDTVDQDSDEELIAMGQQNWALNDENGTISTKKDDSIDHEY
ncbi:hypothetical protein BX600DRAFT_516754 [Xylariales sp. PMI_506]|nr:hypothetical protein BX600DRAFT_516754 [Xylariales sp. PMI_506]